MAGNVNIDGDYVRYLLGKLSDQESARIEERFFADDGSFEELEIAEEELIDAYVRNKLSADDNRLFETKLSHSSRLLERVRFALILSAAVSTAPAQGKPAPVSETITSLVPGERYNKPWWKDFLGMSSSQPAFRMAFAAFALLLLFAGAAMFTEWMKLRRESQRLLAEQEAIQQQKLELERKSAEQQSQNERLTAESQRQRRQQAEDQKLIDESRRAEKQSQESARPPGVPGILSLVLPPGLTRDSGAQHNLIVPPGTSAVRLSLVLDADEYPSYRAVVKNAQGAEVRRFNGLKARRTSASSIIALTLPAKTLTAGNYIVQVEGLTSTGVAEPSNDYAFRVTKP